MRLGPVFLLFQSQLQCCVCLLGKYLKKYKPDLSTTCKRFLTKATLSDTWMECSSYRTVFSHIFVMSAFTSVFVKFIGDALREKLCFSQVMIMDSSNGWSSKYQHFSHVKTCIFFLNCHTPVWCWEVLFFLVYRVCIRIFFFLRLLVFVSLCIRINAQ